MNRLSRIEIGKKREGERKPREKFELEFELQIDCAFLPTSESFI